MEIELYLEKGRPYYLRLHHTVYHEKYESHSSSSSQVHKSVTREKKC